MITMNNVLENDYYIFHFSYSVLTDQQSQIQATNKVYQNNYSIIIIIIKLNECK